MILSILAIILVAGIAYFHWVQGLFSAAISMALALLASAIAIGMHESLAMSLLGGAMADYANPLMLCALFAAVYGIGRILFDMFIPGNVAIPFYMDKVGAGVCGIVAGVFSVGTLLLAAQMLPFGVAIAGFERFATADAKQVVVPGQRRGADAEVSNALDIEGAKHLPDATARQNLVISFDATVLNFASFQSASGALAGDVALAARHPDLLSQLFFSRIGIEPGAKHTALNSGTKNDVGVVKIFSATSLPQVDGELKEIRHPNFNVDPNLKADPNSVIVVVRTRIADDASDKDRNFRVSPGAIRLVAGGENHHPVGTLFNPGNVVLANRIDDYLVINAASDAEVDLVFLLPRTAILAEPAAKEGLKIRDGVFLEVKKLARVDLSGMDLLGTIDPLKEDKVLRKNGILDAISKRLAGDNAN